VSSYRVDVVSLSVDDYLCTIRNILRKVTEQVAVAAPWYLIVQVAQAMGG
jgi:hypothetical protein